MTIVLVSLYAGGAARLWAPLFGIVAGTLVAVPTGMLNWTPVLDAAWFGLPRAGWPGLDLSFDAQFLGLLVPFIIVTIIGAIETNGPAIAIQRVSHRTAVPVDFKVVQRALNADGVDNLLSGLAGTVPNSTYSASISIADLTGVAARRVALWGGIIIVLTASMPKLPALELVSGPDDLNLEDRLGKLDEDHEIVRDVGPRILRHVAKEVKHEQFYDLDLLTVTVDTRPLV